MITGHNVDQYIRSLIPKRDEVLTEMEDRTDFAAYRRNGRNFIPVIVPPGKRN